MSFTLPMEESGPGGIDIARWTTSLCLVLALHLGVSLAILDNSEPPQTAAATESVIMIDLPVEAILPEAQSVQSIAADAVAPVDPSEIVETNEPVLEEVVEETAEVTEETPVEEVLEEPTEMVQEVKPTEVSETALVVAEIVPPTEIVKAEPVEEPKPKPKPRKKPKPVKQQAYNATTNSTAAAGAGRSKSSIQARYDAQIRAGIMRHRIRAPAGAYGRLTITIVIARSGSISSFRLTRSSGNGALDRAALAIVGRVGNLGAIPPELGRSTYSVAVPFNFARQ